MFWDVRDTMTDMGCPTKKVWVTETLYGLLGTLSRRREMRAVSPRHVQVRAAICSCSGTRGTDPTRTKDSLIYHDSATWNEIKRRG